MLVYVVIDDDAQLDGVYTSPKKAEESLKYKKEPDAYQIFVTILDE